MRFQPSGVSPHPDHQEASSFEWKLPVYVTIEFLPPRAETLDRCGAEWEQTKLLRNSKEWIDAHVYRLSIRSYSISRKFNPLVNPQLRPYLLMNLSAWKIKYSEDSVLFNCVQIYGENPFKNGVSYVKKVNNNSLHDPRISFGKGRANSISMRRWLCNRFGYITLTLSRSMDERIIRSLISLFSFLFIFLNTMEAVEIVVLQVHSCRMQSVHPSKYSQELYYVPEILKNKK